MSAPNAQNASANPAGPLAVSGDQESHAVQQGTLLTRNLFVNITGTLANLAMAGPSAGTWKLVDGKQIGVFSMGSEVDAQV
jgi:hypothetical protein